MGAARKDGPVHRKVIAWTRGKHERNRAFGELPQIEGRICLWVYNPDMPGTKKRRILSAKFAKIRLVEQIGKPGSVVGDHLSRIRVAPDLVRPLPEGSAGSFIPFLFGLAPDGVYQASASLRSWWSITPPFQLCPRRRDSNLSIGFPQPPGRRFLFCGTFRRIAPPRC